MDDRKIIAKQLQTLEHQLRELEILYEKYFSGAEKLEPVKLRETIARQLRTFVSRRIMQTDLRYKLQNLATRYHTYAGQWDRILRLMDEGKYVRQLARIHRPVADSAPAPGGVTSRNVDQLYEDLVTAHKGLNSSSRAPKKEQVANFLEKQKDKIRDKYGDREVQFFVVTEDGKPKIKVRAKR